MDADIGCSDRVASQSLGFRLGHDPFFAERNGRSPLAQGYGFTARENRRHRHHEAP